MRSTAPCPSSSSSRPASSTRRASPCSRTSGGSACRASRRPDTPGVPPAPPRDRGRGRLASLILSPFVLLSALAAASAAAEAPVRLAPPPDWVDVAPLPQDAVPPAAEIESGVLYLLW